MNGGYIILNSTYIDELLSKIVSKEEVFSINGFYNYLDSIYKLGKAIIATSKSSLSTSIVFANITKIPGLSSYAVSLIATNIVASIYIKYDDSCSGKYITIGG